MVFGLHRIYNFWNFFKVRVEVSSQSIFDNDPFKCCDESEPVALTDVDKYCKVTHDWHYCKTSLMPTTDKGTDYPTLMIRRSKN